MAHTFFALITATELNEIQSLLEQAKIDGLESTIEKVENSYFLEYIHNTIDVYKTLDYTPWKDVKYIVLIEIDPQAIPITERETPVNCCSIIGLNSNQIAPNYITDNIFIVPVK